MGEHDSLGHAGSAAGIDESAAMTWLDLFDQLINFFLVNSLSLCDELLVVDDSSLIALGLVVFIGVGNNKFDFSIV